MSPVTLADFLLARIAEDEAVAQAATPGPWATQAMAPNLVYGDPPNGVHVCNTGNPMVGEEVIDDALHIARWNPARVLAECKAKRLIVEAEPERWIPQPDAPGPTVDMGTPEGMVRVYGKLITELEYRDRYMELAPPSQTLLYLALPYADHPDYREEWKP